VTRNRIRIEVTRIRNHDCSEHTVVWQVPATKTDKSELSRPFQEIKLLLSECHFLVKIKVTDLGFLDAPSGTFFSNDTLLSLY
jgi:hypothetical protein